MTPLLSAARGGHASVAKLLLRQPKTRTDVCSQQMAPLHWAAANGNCDCIRLLVDEHSLAVDVETQSSHYGHDSIVHKGMTPLMFACKNGNCAAMNFLLNKGADLKKRDAEGYGPLTHAINKDHPECVLNLVRHGAEINVPLPFTANDNFQSPLFIAIKKSCTCLKILLRANVELNNVVSADSRGVLLSPLELALSVPNTSVVCRMLLTAGLRPAAVANPDYLQECLAAVALKDEELFTMVIESVGKCPSLLETCRDKVRAILGRNGLDVNVHRLPLPSVLKDYIRLKELDNL